MNHRRAALAFLRRELDVAAETGDGLLRVQRKFGLRVVEVSALLLEAHRLEGQRAPLPGSALQRLLDSGSAASLPFARTARFRPDTAAPTLDGIGTVKLGKLRIPRLGLGCMRLVSQGGSVGGEQVTAIGLPRSPEASRHALLNAVRVSGVRMLDLARGYGAWPGAGERTLCDWFPSPRRGLIIASKVGYRRTPAGRWMVDLDPEFLRKELAGSRAQFGAPVALMYLVVRSTPATPVVNRPKQLARAFAPLLEAQRAGLVVSLGLANATADEVDAISQSGGLAVVQNRFTLHSLKDKHERAVFDLTWELGLPFVTWGVFGEGVQPRPAAPPAIVSAAEELGVSEEEVTLAALLATAPHVVPLPGPGRRATLDSCLRGAALKLPPATRATLRGALL